MKKRMVIWLLLGLMVWFCIPAAAYGAQSPYRVTGYTGEMLMGADGGLTVTEYITWRVKGSPTITRRLDISCATSVEDIAVYRVTEPDPADPAEAQRAALRRAASEDADTYSWELTEDGPCRYLDFTLRPHTEGRYVTLVFTYRLTDNAFLYQDGAAFSLNPLWQAGEGILDTFFMHCRLAKDIKAGEGTPRYYANGGMTEEWTGSDLYVSRVDLASGLEVVAVLPVSWVPEGRKTVMNNIIPDLDAQQQIYDAQRAELQLAWEKAVRRSRLTLWVAVALMAGGIALIFLLYGRRPSRPKQVGVLVPHRHTPAEVPLLLRKPLTRRGALAELIYLCHRGFLRFVPGEGGWELKQERRSDEGLALHEQYLISWMVHHSGEDASIGERLGDETAFGIWENLVKKDVGRKEILKDAPAAWVIGLGLGIMEWVLAAMIVANVRTWDTALLVGLMGLLVAGYGLTVRKVTPAEMRERVRYRTYARQLRQQKGCAGPWKRQLAYALALGAESRLLNSLIREGSGEVREFALWVKKQDFREKAPQGSEERQLIEGVKTARDEAAVSILDEKPASGLKEGVSKVDKGSVFRFLGSRASKPDEGQAFEPDAEAAPAPDKEPAPTPERKPLFTFGAKRASVPEEGPAFKPDAEAASAPDKEPVSMPERKPLFTFGAKRSSVPEEGSAFKPDTETASAPSEEPVPAPERKPLFTFGAKRASAPEEGRAFEPDAETAPAPDKEPVPTPERKPLFTFGAKQASRLGEADAEMVSILDEKAFSKTGAKREAKPVSKHPSRIAAKLEKYKREHERMYRIFDPKASAPHRFKKR